MTLKISLSHYLLIALIICFFSILFITPCLFNCKFTPPQKVASILLVFFR